MCLDRVTWPQNRHFTEMLFLIVSSLFPLSHHKIYFNNLLLIQTHQHLPTQSSPALSAFLSNNAHPSSSLSFPCLQPCGEQSSFHTVPDCIYTWLWHHDTLLSPWLSPACRPCLSSSAALHDQSSETAGPRRTVTPLVFVQHTNRGDDPLILCMVTTPPVCSGVMVDRSRVTGWPE